MIYIGQSGFPKSGNYLLFRILKGLQEEDGCWRSFNKTHGNWAKFHKNNLSNTSFPEEAEVDHVFIEDDRVYLKVSPVFKAKGKVKNGFELKKEDIKTFSETASLVWTHQNPSAEYFSVFGPQRKWIYILRDGRDVVNSYFHYSVSPRILSLHPEFKLRTLKDIYNNIEYFRKTVTIWRENVEGYRNFKDRFLLVKYEDLVADKHLQIERIIEFLNIDQIFDIEKIVEGTSISSMRNQAPRHIRKGKAGDWSTFFTREHKAAFKKIAGDILIELGYENDMDW